MTCNITNVPFEAVERGKLWMPKIPVRDGIGSLDISEEGDNVLLASINSAMKQMTQMRLPSVKEGARLLKMV